MGRFVRSRYIHDLELLPDTYDQSALITQAVASERTLQSAVAWGQALYPPGFGTRGYYAKLPVPLPVFSAQKDSDDLMETRKGLCRTRLVLEIEHWDRHEGKALLERHGHLIDRLSEQCGLPLCPTGPWHAWSKHSPPGPSFITLWWLLLLFWGAKEGPQGAPRCSLMERDNLINPSCSWP